MIKQLFIYFTLNNAAVKKLYFILSYPARKICFKDFQEIFLIELPVDQKSA